MSILPIRPPRGPFDSVFDEGDYWPDEIKRPNSLANLIVGLGGMFHQPPMQLGINFHPPRPRQDSWFNNWNIGISPGMEELPDYPKTEDQTTGGDIARAWHQMQKDFAHQTMNENFPSYKPHKPQPFNVPQSYDDYMNEHKLVLRNLDPFFLNNYQRAKPEAFSLFGKEEAQDQAAPTPEPSTASIPQPQEPGFFKPLDQMLKEVEERNARGEFFDESGKWVKREAKDSTLPKDSPYMVGDIAGRVSNELPPKTRDGYQPTPQAEVDFLNSLRVTKSEEGGFSNRPRIKDPAGPTMSGVTQDTYDNWRKKNGLGNNKDWPSDVSKLSNKQVETFYREEIYYGNKLDQIRDPKIRHAMFDALTHSSHKGTASFTEKAIKQVLPDVDLGASGVMGSRYRDAMNEITAQGKTNEYLEKLADERWSYLKKQSDLKGQPLHLSNPGWFGRVTRLRPNNPFNVYDFGLQLWEKNN
ncbi:MAG: glycosyl hydrolase 108 family protein [Dongiaceae bacterium]